jgi:glycosyltransferase involved in cell wall biosynthesis
LYASPNNPQDFAVKLAALMDNQSLRSSMGELGRRRIETELAWQYSVPPLLAVYDLVSGSSISGSNRAPALPA